MPSTNKQQFNKRHGYKLNESHSKAEVAKISKMSKSKIETVYARGVAAHRTNPESVRVKGTFKKDPSVPISRKLSAPQWGMARVYSYVNKLESKSKKLNHDKDLL